MSKLELFMQRELELKRTLPFGEWLRHIVKSHEQLIDLVRSGPSDGLPLRVEILDRQDGSLTVTTYELPSECNRVLVDVQGIQGTVWGFCPRAGEPAERQVNANLISKQEGPLVS